MIFSIKKYPCKVFNRDFSDGRTIFKTREVESIVFDTQKNSLMCFCSKGNGNYGWERIQYVTVNKKHLHPIQFIDYIKKGDRNVFA